MANRSAESIARRREWAREHQSSDQGFDGHLRRRYGISIDEWYAMFKAQDGRCAICGKLQGDRRMHVDHDHRTGKVRGLLCAGCNRGVAFLDRDDDWLLTAQAYRLAAEEE
jgi:hypothetical protein